MKLRAWGIAALAACVLTAGAGLGRAQSGGVKNVDFNEWDSVSGWSEDVDQASYQSVTTASVGPGPRGGGYIAGVPALVDRPIQIVAGAQYLYARASFSQGLAYVEQDVAGGETYVQYDFSYNSSYGFYGGFYLCDCGGALMFNYNRLTSDSSFAAADTQNTNVFGPFEVNGDIEGFANVDLKSYDLSFAKTIPLGGPLCGYCGDGCCGDDCCGDDCCGDDCCGGGGGCGNGCGCGCPAWDITWSGGIRFANANWARGATQFDRGTAVPLALDSYTTRMDFDGFGGRVGLMGRRYLGRRGLFSVYAKGDWSILAGRINLETQVYDSDALTTAFHRTSCDHIVPVTEIELGGTLHLGCHANITAGYFWAAWHDLGMREEYSFGNNFQIGNYDDANILGWDGLFVRGEVLF